MKKIIIPIISMLLLFSCAPEKTMNRKINGTWNLITFKGETLPDSLIETVTFKPEGRNGKVTFHIETKNKSIDSLGSYSIMKYECITTSFINNSELGYIETVYNFTKCTNDELILTQQNKPKNVYYFKKVE
jgi:hypothetical protein